jgi:hypothetical protein
MKNQLPAAAIPFPRASLSMVSTSGITHDQIPEIITLYILPKYQRSIVTTAEIKTSINSE